MSPFRDHRAALVFVLALALPLSVTACAKGDPPQAKAPDHTTIAKRASVAPISKQAVEVEASCGQCNFGLAEPQGCDLAVRIQGKAYFVDGAHIDDHGDAQEKAPLVAHRGEYANGSAASGLTAATCKARPAAASQDFGNGIQC